MKSLELLLREHVKDLGRCGDIVKVAPGYARNYLIPRNLAVATTEENKRIVERRKARIEAQEALEAKEAQERVEVLSKIELRTVEKTDETGKLYGSVSAARVVELLAGIGHEVDVKNVRLDAPIKTVGAHVIQVHVAGELNAELTIHVDGDQPITAPAEAPAEASAEAPAADAGAGSEA